jgi:hypothetical protein
MDGGLPTHLGVGEVVGGEEGRGMRKGQAQDLGHGYSKFQMTKRLSC